ncbi:uncharacterized protein LOC125057398 [Pieris napi]|uniref:uncharacterized protein LOC125057398 n=1 Tax=Pieris napi TaxID=78633 RepID=UPI001FB94A5D|nr:uncharacterized protein LOC125057398 [Pieris napi]
MMGAFVLFLFLIYINENIAIIPNEQTFPLNVKSKVSPAAPYNLPIRRYKEEYYDPFLHDINSETQNRKEFFDNPSYRFYKDDDSLKSERFNFKLPPQSRRDNEYRTLKRNPEISPENHCLQSKINYNDFSTQDLYPSKEMANAEKPNCSNRENVLKSKTLDMEEDIAKIQHNPDKFYGKNNYTSHYYERLDNPKTNENRISNPEYDAHLKLHNNSFMQIPLKAEYSLDNAYMPHISQVECRGVNKNYSEFSERIPLDNRHINKKPGTNLPGNYRTSNEAVDFKDQTRLKHSLTSSASAVENRLLTSHITKTFEKVKGDEENIPDGPLNDIPFWKSNKKYMNSLENKLRNLYADNHTKDVQNIIEQSKTTLAPSMLPQQIVSQQINNTKPFESHKTYDNSSLSTTPGVTGISLSDKSRNRLNENPGPSVHQTCTETRHENSFSNRTMEEMNPAKFLRRQIQTTANQIIPSHYDMAKNSKPIGATQETPQRYDKLYRSPTFDVNSKLINDCIRPINVNNHNGSNKQMKHDMLNLKSSVPLNGFDIRNNTSERIKAIYYPSNNKSSLLYNGSKNNVNCDCIRTNAEGVFIQPNLAIDNSFVKCDIKNIVPESIESSLNQVPRCYLGRNNLTSRQDGDSINQDISGVVYKIPEVHPSIDEPYIIHPNSISKNYMENLSNSNKYYALPSLTSPINLNNEDKGRMYTSPMYVQPTPIKVYPQQTTINVKSIHNTPVISAAPYTVQAPKYSFYEINKPKVTFLNPTKSQNPEGYKNPTVTTIAPKVLQQNDSKLNLIKPKGSNVLANNGYQVHSPINKYNSLLSASLNNITSVIVSNILSSFNKDISKTLKKPLCQGSNVTPISCEIPTFEVTHPCIESPRYLPKTPIKIRKDNSTSTSTNKSSKPSVSTITINVLPPVQQISNDIIILV